MNETIEISMTDYRELLDQDTRHGILRRLINDTDRAASEKGYGRQIDTALLRQVLGMASYEKSADV